jgi:hypothetical protein
MSVIGTSSAATTCSATAVVEMVAPAAAPLKNDIKVGMLVKVVRTPIGYEKFSGVVGLVFAVGEHGVCVHGVSLWLAKEHVQVQEPPKEALRVGDFVHGFPSGAPIMGRIVETITTYVVKDFDGGEKTVSHVLPMSTEEREAFVSKRRNELLKIASDAMQESMALGEVLVEKPQNGGATVPGISK